MSVFSVSQEKAIKVAVAIWSIPLERVGFVKRKKNFESARAAESVRVASSIGHRERAREAEQMRIAAREGGGRGGATD